MRERTIHCIRTESVIKENQCLPLERSNVWSIWCCLIVWEEYLSDLGRSLSLKVIPFGMNICAKFSWRVTGFTVLLTCGTIYGRTKPPILQGQEYDRYLSSSPMFPQEWQIQNNKFSLLSYFLTQRVVLGKYLYVPYYFHFRSKSLSVCSITSNHQNWTRNIYPVIMYTWACDQAITNLIQWDCW